METEQDLLTIEKECLENLLETTKQMEEITEKCLKERDVYSVAHIKIVAETMAMQVKALDSVSLAIELIRKCRNRS